MKIKFTKHAEEKFKKLPLGSVNVGKVDVLNAINKPLFKDLESDRPKIIVHGSLDTRHIVRVVYKRSISANREENGIITIITFYPTRKGRYEQK